MFGIRGNIDATVQIKMKIRLSTQQNKNDEWISKLLPFQLKTGKDNISALQKARAQYIA